MCGVSYLNVLRADLSANRRSSCSFYFPTVQTDRCGRCTVDGNERESERGKEVGGDVSGRASPQLFCAGLSFSPSRWAARLPLGSRSGHVRVRGCCPPLLPRGLAPAYPQCMHPRARSDRWPFPSWRLDKHTTTGPEPAAAFTIVVSRRTRRTTNRRPCSPALSLWRFELPSNSINRSRRLLLTILLSSLRALARSRLSRTTLTDKRVYLRRAKFSFKLSGYNSTIIVHLTVD